jgi:hypothetical protein
MPEAAYSSIITRKSGWCRIPSSLTIVVMGTWRSWSHPAMVDRRFTIPGIDGRKPAGPVPMSLRNQRGERTMIFRLRIRIARLLVTAAEKLAYLARKVAPRPS